MLLKELDTPAVIVDRDKMEQNLRQMAGHCKKYSIGLRPHIKTHKCPEIARMQLDSGALGLAVAKVGEAEVMVETGCKDIQIAYPVFGRQKLERLMPLTKKTAITVSLDSIEIAEGISQKAQDFGCIINILIEVDVGFHRCGIPVNAGIVEFARKVATLPNLNLKGLMIYPGHIWFGPNHKESDWDTVKTNLKTIRKFFQDAKLPLDVVSTGGTPNSRRTQELEGITETRVGTYPFLDMNYVDGAGYPHNNCSLTVMVTVVSSSVPDVAIIDGGAKTFAGDGSILGPNGGFGYVVDDPDLKFIKMNEEHGFLDISKTSRHIQIGDRLRIIPNHVCTTINMHNQIFGYRGERVEVEWKVAARGKVQ